MKKKKKKKKKKYICIYICSYLFTSTGSAFSEQTSNLFKRSNNRFKNANDCSFERKCNTRGITFLPLEYDKN